MPFDCGLPIQLLKVDLEESGRIFQRAIYHVVFERVLTGLCQVDQRSFDSFVGRGHTTTERRYEDGHAACFLLWFVASIELSSAGFAEILASSRS